jgi:hypothetical protein
MQLGAKMAGRNHLYLFAWLCAIVVPVALQVVAGMTEEAREYLAYYYGPISLFMFFAMTYGFAAVFVGYYLVGGYRRKGSLDCLRVARIYPWEVVAGAFLAMQRVLVPPLVVFAVGFGIYLFALPEEGFIARDPWLVFGVGMLFLANEAIVCGLMLTGLFRREGVAALLAALLSFVLNLLPVTLVYMLGWPIWIYALMLLGMLTGLLLLASAMVGRLWPAQRMPRRAT